MKVGVTVFDLVCVFFTVSEIVTVGVVVLVIDVVGADTISKMVSGGDLIPLVIVGVIVVLIVSGFNVCEMMQIGSNLVFVNVIVSIIGIYAVWVM